MAWRVIQNIFYRCTLSSVGASLCLSFCWSHEFVWLGYVWLFIYISMPAYMFEYIQRNVTLTRMCASVRIKSGRYSLSDSSLFSFPSKYEQICIHLFCSSYRFAYINCRLTPNLPNQVIFYYPDTQMKVGVEKFSPRSNSQKLT